MASAGCLPKLNPEQREALPLMFTSVSRVKIWSLMYLVGVWGRE